MTKKKGKKLNNVSKFSGFNPKENLTKNIGRQCLRSTGKRGS